MVADNKTYIIENGRKFLWFPITEHNFPETRMEYGFNYLDTVLQLPLCIIEEKSI